METDQEAYQIFKKGSTTFFGSSVFFPESIRHKVTALYAFVRCADDYIDCIPQQKNEFYEYWKLFKQVRQGLKSSNSIINNYVELEYNEKFDPDWMDSFFISMEQDLKGKKYHTIEETEEYIYGSANTIGLFMAKLMRLPAEAYPYAEMLGKSLQFINFIRDITEDLELERQYFPQEDFDRFSLHSLALEDVCKQPLQFTDFIEFQLKRYQSWQKEAEKGFKYLPKHYLIPIKTASDLYKWTAKMIKENPFIVYEKKLKPSKVRILFTGVTNLFR